MKKKVLGAGTVVIAAVMLMLFLQGPWVHRSSFAHNDSGQCEPLLGWFTKEERLISGDNGLDEVELQPGDILVTLSTHSVGWRHGHAALVVNENITLESLSLGIDSKYCSMRNWGSYATVAVLRVKDVSKEKIEQVLDFSRENLYGKPYRLLSGLVGQKAPAATAAGFGVQCAYLPWYAWQHFGYDLDSDGGSLVTPHDLLESELVDVIYIYGMQE